MVACAAALAVASLGACASSTTGGSAFDTGGLPTAAPTELAFDAEILDELADEAAGLGSTCFLVARQGKVVLARYWNGGGAEAPQEVYSVTKSVTSTLVGLAQADGDLSIDDPASTYIDDWQGTPSETVTVRQLPPCQWAVLEQGERLPGPHPGDRPDRLLRGPRPAGGPGHRLGLQQRRGADP